MSRTDPSNQGNVKCRFGRVFTYQDALEQFEVLITLPILLIGVTPQDLLELTDINSLKQQVSPMSTPDRRQKLANKSPHRLGSPTSTPDRYGGLTNMDLRNRLGSGRDSSSSVQNENRFAAQAAEAHNTNVTPNRSEYSISAKTKMDASPVSMHPPDTIADKNPSTFTTEAGKMSIRFQDGDISMGKKNHTEVKKSVEAILQSKPDTTASSTVSSRPTNSPTNPFFIPSPKTTSNDENIQQQAESKKSKKSSLSTASSTDKVNIDDSKSNYDVKDKSSGSMTKILIFFASVLCIWVVSLLLFSGSDTASKNDGPVFNEKPVSIFWKERVFAIPEEGYMGLLTPDIFVENMVSR